MSQGNHPVMVIYRFGCMLFLAYMERLFERFESIRQENSLVLIFCRAYQVESVLCEKRDSLIESRRFGIVTVESDRLLESVGSDFYT